MNGGKLYLMARLQSSGSGRVVVSPTQELKFKVGLEASGFVNTNGE